jgi:hypothetical protein
MGQFLAIKIKSLICSEMRVTITFFFVTIMDIYEHSEKARVPHTNGPRDVPRCGALSLLQKPLHYRGGSQENWCSTLL